MMNEVKLPLRGQVPFKKALLEGQNTYLKLPFLKHFPKFTNTELSKNGLGFAVS